MDRWRRFLVQAGFAALVPTLVTLTDRQWAGYGFLAWSLFAARLFVVALNNPRDGEPPPFAVVVPAYNEDPAVLRACLLSIAAQDYARPLRVVLVDDGSAQWDARMVAEVAARFERAGISFRVRRHETNLGKREAIAVGLRTCPGVDVLVCVDSDTVIAPDGLRGLVGAFADRRVGAATGLVTARNRSANLLTRLIDVRYTTAFEFDRAGQSALGAMLCACGSMAAYRTSTLHRWIGDFLGQRFLGEPCSFGDDRRLTAYAVRAGRSVYVRRARAWTEVPETMDHFVRQQARWSRSWMRESVLGLRQLSPRRIAWWLVAFEFVGWFALTAGLLRSLWHVTTEGSASPGYVLGHLAIVALFACSRAAPVLFRDDLRWTQRVGGLVVAPLYSLLNIAVLVAVRTWAFATPRVNRWGTRG